MISKFSFSENTVGFILSGRVDDTIIEKFQSEILDKLESFDKINLYLEDNGIDSFSLSAIFNEIQFKMSHANRFSKIVLVTDRTWIKFCGDIEGLFMGAEVTSFTTEKRLDAMNWIAA